MNRQPIDAPAALDRFFAVVRQEARDNPKFASSLLDALGVEVVFRGEEARMAIDPLLVAIKGQQQFRETFLSFSVADLKKIIKDFGLASQAELRGKSKVPQLVDLMWEGAQAKVHDRGLNRRALGR